jgi:type I restriction enzyme S subunit
MNDLETKIKNIFQETDRADWEMIKFGDIAFNISERVEPGDTATEIYVGLEHLDPDSLHIRRNGVPSDVKGTKLKVYKGDVIFGKRRAYQRKAAIADFDCICSAHAMVLRASLKKVDPNFFPFFLHSDTFMNKAVEVSEGSLSPTIKWKNLKEQKFRLPPLPIQKKLSELLWAIDQVRESYLLAQKSLFIQYEALVEKYFGSAMSNNWNSLSLGKVADLNSESLASSRDKDFEFNYLDIASIVAPKKLGEMQKLRFSLAPSRARRVVHENDIVISLVRPYQMSLVLIKNADKVIASTGTGVVTVNPNIIDARFAFHQFFTKRFLRFCEDRMTGTNYPAITSNDLKEFDLYLPNDLRLQTQIANKLDALDSLRSKVELAITTTDTMMRSLVNKITSL